VITGKTLIVRKNRNLEKQNLNKPEQQLIVNNISISGILITKNENSKEII
jgi:hypothetical protein